MVSEGVGRCREWDREREIKAEQRGNKLEQKSGTEAEQKWIRWKKVQ